MSLRTLTAAVVEPVTLVEAKQFLRLDGAAEDALMAVLISAAREGAELFTGQALAAASYRHTVVRPEAGYRVPLRPLASIEAVRAGDGRGGDWEDLVEGTDYTIDLDTGRALIFAPPAALQVDFTTATEVRASVKRAMLVWVAHLFENRGDHEMPPVVHDLLWPFRSVSL